MMIELVRSILGWCTVINVGLLLYWFLIFVLAHDWIFKLHRRWFQLSVEQFDAMHYAGMGLYKIGIALLNVVPYVAICLAD